MRAIYLDFNATTPIDPEVAAVMTPLLWDTFGNPSSEHSYGVEAKMALESARGQVARLIAAEPAEIVFTSGGTESNNLAIVGALEANRDRGNHIVISNVEHPAVSAVCRRLENSGVVVSVVEVSASGRLRPEAVARACRSDTVLISVMLANNEIGTIQPIKEIAAIAREHGVLVHSDGAQAVGKIPVDVHELGVDFLSIAGHKLYAPKGVGALYTSRGAALSRLMEGGDHEKGLRPGTENVLLAVGLGMACEVAGRKMATAMEHMRALRDALEAKLLERLGPESVRVNGRGADRLPNTSSVSFRGIDASALLTEIGHRVAASAGAACHADSVDLSPVLRAINIPEEWGRGTIRFSVGRETTLQEIAEAAGLIVSAATRMKQGRLVEPADSRDGVRLTRFTKGMGCACKIRPEQLDAILKEIRYVADDRVVVDMKTSDDAAIYRVPPNKLLVQSVDFLTPVVDDPYLFGQVAAANSLSDIYAMGATPLFALNLVAFPSARLPISVLTKILEGAADKCVEAGVSVVGGHSIDDPEPKFGLVVTGVVAIGKAWTNSGARAGDALIITKPLGTGLIATGVKKGVVSAADAETAGRLMSMLNGPAARCLSSLRVHACTDVTGFGLLGHAREMLLASQVSAEIYAGRTPMIKAALKLAGNDMISSGTKANLSFVEQDAHFDSNVPLAVRTVLADAQTSGGLLAAVPADAVDAALDRLHRAGVRDAAFIGAVTDGPAGRMTITD